MIRKAIILSLVFLFNSSLLFFGIYGCVPTTCTEDGDCPIGSYCWDNGVCGSDCQRHEDCADGEICDPVFGRCEVGTGSSVSCTLNPYIEVDWSTWNQYKANYHTHTTEGGGSDSPSEVIDQYYYAGYAILAITDHNTITWPWTSYGRNPEDLNMLAVRGDEYSNSHHINALYDFSVSSSFLENGIPHIQSSGGLCQINHPGRYSLPSNWGWYIPWLQDYPACVVLEVVNQADRYPLDRQLWDNINERLFAADGKLVWGTANDDKHISSDLYHSFQFMLMPELTESEHRKSMTNGTFYFCIEPGQTGDADVPRIVEIDVDDTAQTITITATDYDSITWVGPGTTTVGAGATFDYTEYLYQPFVRAVLNSSSGECYTQPFGMETY